MKVRTFNMLNMCTNTGTQWDEEQRKCLGWQLLCIAMRFKLGIRIITFSHLHAFDGSLPFFCEGFNHIL